MKIRIICTDKELQRIDDIQESFNDAMHKLTLLGFTGQITIEDNYDHSVTKMLTRKHTFNKKQTTLL